MIIDGGDTSAAATRISQTFAARNAAANGVTTAVSANAATASSGATSTAAAGDITSNDFLTLLVTEMKNQDPTQPTDPNAYIQQLVGVNSLQQLISINQELGPTTSTASPAPVTPAVTGTSSVTHN